MARPGLGESGAAAGRDRVEVESVASVSCDPSDNIYITTLPRYR